MVDIIKQYYVKASAVNMHWCILSASYFAGFLSRRMWYVILGIDKTYNVLCFPIENKERGGGGIGNANTGIQQMLDMVT